VGKFKGFIGENQRKNGYAAERLTKERTEIGWYRGRKAADRDLSHRAAPQMADPRPKKILFKIIQLAASLPENILLK